MDTTTVLESRSPPLSVKITQAEEQLDQALSDGNLGLELVIRLEALSRECSQEYGREADKYRPKEQASVDLLHRYWNFQQRIRGLRETIAKKHLN